MTGQIVSTRVSWREFFNFSKHFRGAPHSCYKNLMTDPIYGKKCSWPTWYFHENSSTSTTNPVPVLWTIVSIIFKQNFSVFAYPEICRRVSWSTYSTWPFLVSQPDLIAHPYFLVSNISYQILSDRSLRTPLKSKKSLITRYTVKFRFVCE